MWAKHALRLAEDGMLKHVAAPLAIVGLSLLEAVKEDVLTDKCTILQMRAIKFKTLIIILRVDKVPIVVLLVDLSHDRIPLL